MFDKLEESHCEVVEAKKRVERRAVDKQLARLPVPDCLCSVVAVVDAAGEENGRSKAEVASIARSETVSEKETGLEHHWKTIGVVAAAAAADNLDLCSHSSRN